MNKVGPLQLCIPLAFPEHFFFQHEFETHCVEVHGAVEKPGWILPGKGWRGLDSSVGGSRIYSCAVMGEGFKEWGYLCSHAASICAVHLPRPVVQKHCFLAGVGHHTSPVVLSIWDVPKVSTGRCLLTSFRPLCQNAIFSNLRYQLFSACLWNTPRG